MESVPLLPESKGLPNPDVSPLITELFQNEFEEELPSKNITKNILKSLKHYTCTCSESQTFRSVEFIESLAKRKDNVMEFADNVLRAYRVHEDDLEDIKDAEKNVIESQIPNQDPELSLAENKMSQAFIALKRQPIFKPLNQEYVKKYKLLQASVGLPPHFISRTDFRVKYFKDKQKNLLQIRGSSFYKQLPSKPCLNKTIKVKKEKLALKPICDNEKSRSGLKRGKSKRKDIKILEAEPKVLLFTEYKIGDVYVAEIRVKNVYCKGVKFQLKPSCPDSPFKVTIHNKNATKIHPGLKIRLLVEFTPNSLDNVAEDIEITMENGLKLLIPMVAYLEPPVLKTHKEIDEFTRNTSERILSSYIECGACFSGDTKVTKIRFQCYRGCGEFFIMSSENWNRSYINNISYENVLEIPPFKVYPVFFKVDKNEVIDLYVEFSPKFSGMHVENILIACNNGEVRSLDILADAVGWHSYYFSFQDSLLKEFPVDTDDDMKVKYYLNLNDTSPSGKVEKVFCVSNNSSMSFDFQWKIRDANISPNPENYMKLSKCQIKIDPESGTFEPNSIWEFQVTVTFNEAEIGEYRTVLSLYVLNLPYQCIEEDNTIIQPTGMVRNLYTQSLYGDEEGFIPSAEILSLQGTYESLQESIKSYVECQTKTQTVSKLDFCKNYCIPNPDLCAKPLKKSKTFFNIGDSIDDDVFTCGCRMKPSEPESASESYTSNNKANESTAPKTEVIWDFVDILVDEIEVWVEVIGARVVLNPSIVELSKPIMVNEPPFVKQVEIYNHNRSPISCKWVRSMEELSSKGESQSKDNVLVSLLFLNSSSKEKEKIPEKHIQIETDKDGVMNQLLPIVKSLAIKTRRHNTCIESCTITTDPKTSFTVCGLSQFTCYIGLSAKEPGEIKEEVCLYVNDGELKLSLMILGKAVKKQFFACPNILDFGVVKQKTRNKKSFKIINESSLPLFWHIREYKFDFTKGEFRESYNTYSGPFKILRSNGSCAEPELYLETKKVGLKCSIIEIESRTLESYSYDNQYVMVLGQVKVPKLEIYARRFDNAILAPPGMMNVDQKVNTVVILSNTGSLDTTFIWGRPFGCHSRKIKVEFQPKKDVVKKKEKLTINVILTPLEEGIISHCYVPCFFCHKKDPLILSIVGIISKLNVTFEILDLPDQNHANANEFSKTYDYYTILRVPWPIKIFDTTLGKKFISEEDVLNMKCYCAKIGIKLKGIAKNIKQEMVYRGNCSEKQGNSKTCDIIFTPLVDIQTFVRNINCTSVEQYSSTADKVSGKLTNKISFSCTTSVNPDDLDKDKSLGKISQCEKGLSEKNSVQKVSLKNFSFESLRFIHSELEFLNVPYRTPIVRKFVIRNETSVATSFRIRVSRYKCQENNEKRVEYIKSKVYKEDIDEYAKLLPKNQPLAINVEPSAGELDGFDAVCISVIVYGDTWGEYRDHLLCQIKGIQFYRLKMFIQIVGHPIYFPMFRTQVLGKPVLRFQPLYYTCQPATKKIKVLNRSAINLTIHWIVFLLEPSFKDEIGSPTESIVNVESSYSGEDSSKSLKNYIPKNSSATLSAFKNLDMKETCEMSEGFDVTNKNSFSDKKVSVEFNSGNDSVNSIYSSDELKSEIQQFSNFGNVDSRIFKVEPREMAFEPYEEKTMSITFKPGFWKNEFCAQIYKGVLTCCVRLKPEDERVQRVFYRPCGINFVSEVLEFDAATEVPLASFEILKGDLKFNIDANAVIKSPKKQYSIQRVYKIKNNNQKRIIFKVDVIPGVVFHTKSINTVNKLYRKYDPDVHEVTIEGGEVCEFELECLVTYKDVMYAFEQLKLSRKREASSPMSEKTATSKSKTCCSEIDKKDKHLREPWLQYFACTDNENLKCTIENFKLEHRDSFEINVNRMSSRSNSVCYDIYGKNYYGEMEGEYWELPGLEEIDTTAKTPQHVIHAKEDISFTQTGIIMQTIQAELHLSFPSIKMYPQVLDFGNVYIGETAVRYSTFSNLTGYPTEFKIKPRPTTSDFEAKPLTGLLPPTNPNSNNGVTVTVEFKPSQPGYYREVFQIYSNINMEFDCYELFVSGLGTWNEKYKFPKYESSTKIKRLYPQC